MTDYLVKWSIDIVAESPEEAALQALAIQRDPNSWATVFKIEQDGSIGTTVDTMGITGDLA